LHRIQKVDAVQYRFLRLAGTALHPVYDDALFIDRFVLNRGPLIILTRLCEHESTLSNYCINPCLIIQINNLNVYCNFTIR
jgi:hypothetical protein